MAFTTLETQKINWPDQANLPEGPASFPAPTLMEVDASAVAYDQTGNGNAEFANENGLQFRNAVDRTFLFLSRSLPEEVILLDEALADAIRQELRLPQTYASGDQLLTRPITAQDMLSLRKLTAHNVTDLTGLNRATNLHTLDLSDSQIRNTDGLRGLQNLKRLSLENCQNLTDIAAVLNLPALKVLNLLGVPNTKRIALQALSCRGIQILDDQNLFGTIVRQLTLVLEDGGDSQGLTYLLQHNSVSGQYKMTLLGKSENLSAAITAYQLRSMDDNLVAEIPDIENIPSVNIYLMLHAPLKLIAQNSLGDYVECETELLNPAGSTSPTELPSFTADSNLLAALQSWLLTDEVPALSNLTTLTEFGAFGASLTDLTNLGDLFNLRSIDLSFNQIETLAPVYDLPLTSINVMHNADLDDFHTAPFLSTLNYANVIGIEPSSLLADAVANLRIAGCEVHDSLDRQDLIAYEEEIIAISEDNEIENVLVEAAYKAQFKRFYGSLTLPGGEILADTVSFYSGLPCDVPVEGQLIVSLPYAYGVYPADYHSTASSNVNITVASTDDFSNGDMVSISSVNYYVIVVDATTLTLIDCDLVSGDFPTSMGRSSVQLRNDLLGQLTENFFMTFSKNGENQARLTVTYSGYEELQYTLRSGPMSPAPITELSDRIVTEAENSPIEITYTGPPLDNEANVNISGSTNLGANGNFILEDVTSTTATLPASNTDGAHTVDATLRPNEITAAGEIELVPIVNPFLQTHLVELRVTHAVQDYTAVWLEGDGKQLLQLPEPDEESDNEYTINYALLRGELDLFALPEPVVGYVTVYTNTYIEGALSSSRLDPFVSLTEFNNVYVRILTHLEVESFGLSPLDITLPPTGQYPKMVGPFDQVFHTVGQVGNRTYQDIVQLLFKSDIQNGQPVNGDIKIAVYKVGA